MLSRSWRRLVFGFSAKTAIIMAEKNDFEDNTLQNLYNEAKDYDKSGFYAGTLLKVAEGDAILVVNDAKLVAGWATLAPMCSWEMALAFISASQFYLERRFQFSI